MQIGTQPPNPDGKTPLEPAELAAARPRPHVAQAAAAVAGQQSPPPQGPETDLWAGRISLKYFLGRICGWLTSIIVVSILAYILVDRTDWVNGRTATWFVLALAASSGAVVMGGVLLRVLGTHYRLTTQRLFITRGILSHSVDQTELIRVDDVRLYKSLFGRLFDVGNVTVLTTDASDRNIQIEGVNAPDAVAENIRGRMRALRGRSVYVESL